MIIWMYILFFRGQDWCVILELVNYFNFKSALVLLASFLKKKKKKKKQKIQIHSKEPHIKCASFWINT